MPRPIDHVLDSIFYSNLKRSGVGNDEMDDSVPRSKDWDPFASTDTFMGEERESDDDDDDETKKESRRKHAVYDDMAEEKDDEGDDDIEAAGGPITESEWDGSKWVDKPEKKKKDSRRRRLTNLDNFGDKKAEPFGSSEDDEDEQDENKTSAIHTAPGGGAHGPYEIEDSGGNYKVVNNNGETKGTHDTYDQAREQQKALYVNVPEAQEQAKSKSSRRRLVDSNIAYANKDDDGSISGLTFTPPSKVRGSWSCNDCGADDLGVHDLNGHAQAHKQTTHRAGYDLFL